MNIKEILNFRLIETGHFAITTYNLLIIIIIIFITIATLNLINRLMKRLAKKKKINQGGATSIFLIIKYFIWIIIFVVILDTLGVKVSVLMASVAALLVGVGLGLQQLFNDIASGIIILFERNIKVKDIMEIEGEDEIVGEVINIGLRTSKIKTRDDIIMTIPNSKLVNERTINWSLMGSQTRFYVAIGVEYGSDVGLVKKLLLQVAKEHPELLKKPNPFVRFADFGDSSLNFELYFWSNKSFVINNIKSDLRFAIDKIFRENKITIPFPQRVVHMN